MRAALLALLPLALTGCMFGPEPVVRVVNGREHVGRYISSRAYASYAEGAYYEAKGQPQKAERKYRQALDEDPDSAAIWTRIGALSCLPNAAEAASAFKRAAAIDASYAPLWRERARCDLRHGELAPALVAAKRAFSLDPDDEDTSVVLASAYDKQGRHAAALRWLTALVERDPKSLPGWRALLSTAQAAKDKPTELRAARALMELSPQARRTLEQRYPSLDPLAAVDRALRSGNVASAHERALAAHMGPGDLAVRAAELGLPRLAARFANEVLAADPRNANAWIALLVAADLSGDQAAFDSALASLAHDPVPPRPAAARLLGALLRRRAGAAAEHRWLFAYGLPSAKKASASKSGNAPPVTE